MAKAIKKIVQLFQNVYRSRRLLFSLSFKDFKRRFAGSYFGMVWGFVQPFLTILVYWIVFQFGFRSGPTRGAPFVLWFMCGIVPWLFISEAISSASNALLEYSYLVKKVVFNIDILPLVKILSSAFIHLCFIVLLMIVSCVVGYYPSIFLLQLPYYFLCLVFLVFALTLFSSAVMVFFRDLNQIIGIVLLIGMWGTPIAWNPDILSEKAQYFIKLNPIYYIVEGYRDAFIGGTWFWHKYMQMGYFWAILLALLIFGSVVFNRLKPHFADVL